MTMKLTGPRVWVLRIVALVAAMTAALPAGMVGASFFPLVRHSIQLAMLPAVPGATLMSDSCAMLRMNRLPKYCERIFTLTAPNRSVAVDYPNAVKAVGWEQESYYTGLGYDWDSRRSMKIECYVFRSFVWGVNEHIVLAVFDDQWFRFMGGANTDFCNRSSKFR